MVAPSVSIRRGGETWFGKKMDVAADELYLAGGLCEVNKPALRLPPFSVPILPSLSLTTRLNGNGQHHCNDGQCQSIAFLWNSSPG